LPQVRFPRESAIEDKTKKFSRRDDRKSMVVQIKHRGWMDSPQEQNVDTLGIRGREREAVLQSPVSEAVDRELESAFYSVHARRFIGYGNVVNIKRSGNIRADCSDHPINGYSEQCDT
jgi:hypothetical protein